MPLTYKQANFTKRLMIFLFSLLIITIGFCMGYNSKESVIITHPTDYHLDCDAKTGYYIIYTEDMKEIGRIKYETVPSLNSIINMDNQ